MLPSELRSARAKWVHRAEKEEKVSTTWTNQKKLGWSVLGVEGLALGSLIHVYVMVCFVSIVLDMYTMRSLNTIARLLASTSR